MHTRAMERQDWGEEKMFVRVLFVTVGPAIRCISSDPKMKNVSGVEQFNQYKK